MKFLMVVSLLALTFLSAFAADQPALKKFTLRERLQPEQLKATHEAVRRFAQERVKLPELQSDLDLRAAMNVETETAGQPRSTRKELIAAARKAGVQIVMFNDHAGARTKLWPGLHEGILFFAGAAGEVTNMTSEGYARMEIANRRPDAAQDQTLQAYCNEFAGTKEKSDQLMRLHQAYPEELYGAGSEYPEALMARWDREMQKRPVVGLGVPDAPRSVIFRGTVFDPHEVVFRNLSTHILAPELTEAAVREALRAGHCYGSHDWLCDPTGFTFGAVNNLGVFPMGDRAPFFGATRIVGLTPLAAQLKLFRNGTLVAQNTGTNLNYDAKETGAYRLEAWLNVAGEARPWIYSNPVHVRLPTASELELPSSDIATTVEVQKDIAYTHGKPQDSEKHKLDVYSPKGKESAPVFFFVHGGAWRFGDRTQYPAIGNRFAKEGIVTVVPSYRLAPQDPFPAQIEDVAAAFAWTVKHIAEHGGDPKRIYVGGHSAGGHLAALLALNDRHLKAHNLSTGLIRGAVCLSGVYNLAIIDSMASVFGKDEMARRDASPLFHIRPPAPPFLVTYCQWDYVTLPLQARAFHGALRKAGVASELVYVPGETHITEMIHVPKAGDMTAKAVIGFIK